MNKSLYGNKYDLLTFISQETNSHELDKLIFTNYTYYGLWKITSDRAGLGILLFIFSLCTVFGNILVIIAVIRERYLQTATNYFITSLAFADCLVGFVVMPFSAIYEVFEKRWLFTLNWCDAWRSLDVLFSTASILNLCVISVDRYWAIKDPFSYPSRMTRKLASVLITSVWLASSLISFPAIIWWRAVRTNRVPQDKCPFTINLEYIIFSSAISFYLPLFVMVFTYYKIYREAVIQTKSLRIGTKHVMIASGELELTLRMHRGGNLTNKNKSERNNLFCRVSTASKDLQNFNNSMKRESLKTLPGRINSKHHLFTSNKNFSLSRKFAKFSKEKKAAKTLGIVMGVFIICWLPFFVVNLWSGFCAKCIWREDIISAAVSWLGWINSGMNPVIYACWSRDFRRAFIRILCSCCPQRMRKRYQRAFRYKPSRITDMSVNYRYESGTKSQYKGKFIIMYESIFKGEDLTMIYPNFWNELFLIKPVISFIENEISRLNEESLIHCKKNINLLVSYCIHALCDENAYRIVYSIQTLSTLLFSLYKKVNHNERTFNFLDITFGLNDVEKKIAVFLHNTNVFLTGDYPLNLKSLCIKLFIIIATGLDNINKNVLLDYIMSSEIFESLIQLLRDTSSRNQHGFYIILILTLLVNYRKHESANPFIVKLSILDDELALNGYGQVISSYLSSFCKQFTQVKPDKQMSWIASFTGIIGNIFVDEEENRTHQIQENNSLLLALYEATHLNRNFITTLAYTQTETPLPQISNNAIPSKQLLIGFRSSDIAAQPFNLLAIFFQYCSIVIQVTRTETITHNVKLCFLILSCISEDQYANSLMHDANLAFRVQLHKIPMHRRKFNTNIASSQPLAATLLDLIVEFVTSNMMKKFPLDLYHQCIGILLRILCYQKRCRVRLNYQWIKLWTVLINLIKFLSTNEHYLAKKMNIFCLATEVVNILNIFITYGDMFLSSPSTYDELFYEIIRMKSIFINLNTMGLRYSTNEAYEYKESAQKLTSALVNMRDIFNHFPPKISEWLSRENISTPTQNQIMEIIINNYDTLTLKLEDNLDQFERYSENPKHFDFFNNLVKSIIATARTSINIHTLDAESILREYYHNSWR